MYALGEVLRIDYGAFWHYPESVPKNPRIPPGTSDDEFF